MGGCMVGPNYKVPKVDVPVFLATTQPTAASLSRWWEQFHDPQLDILIERALVSNLDLQLAQDRVLEARAAGSDHRQPLSDGQYQRRLQQNAHQQTGGSGGIFGRGAGSDSKPDADQSACKFAGGSHGPGPARCRGAGSSASGGLVLPQQLQLYQAGFDASWEIDIFGGLRRSVEAAVADVQAQEESRATPW